MLLVMALGAPATTYYIWRVTGNPFTLPQQVNRNTYAIARYFYWQSAYPEPTYRHKVIHDFYHAFELREFQRAQTISGILLQLAAKIVSTWVFYAGPVLTLPLLMLPWVLRD